MEKNRENMKQSAPNGGETGYKYFDAFACAIKPHLVFVPNKKWRSIQIQFEEDKKRTQNTKIIEV